MKNSVIRLWQKVNERRRSNHLCKLVCIFVFYILFRETFSISWKRKTHFLKNLSLQIYLIIKIKCIICLLFLGKLTEIDKLFFRMFVSDIYVDTLIGGIFYWTMAVVCYIFIRLMMQLVAYFNRQIVPSSPVYILPQRICFATDSWQCLWDRKGISYGK